MARGGIGGGGRGGSGPGSGLMETVGGAAKTGLGIMQQAAQNLKKPFSQVFGEVSGNLTDFPQITQGPIYSPQQIQQQVNQGSQLIGQQAQSNILDIQQKQMGRGFGSQSPATAALVNQQNAMSMIGQADLRRQLPFEIAQQNAQHLLATQQAGVGRAQAMSTDELNRRNLVFQMLGLDVDALAVGAGMFGGGISQGIGNIGRVDVANINAQAAISQALIKAQSEALDRWGDYQGPQSYTFSPTTRQSIDISGSFNPKFSNPKSSG